MQNVSHQISQDRHEIVAHHILRMGSLLESAAGQSFLVIQGRDPHEIMGKIPKETVDNPSFEFSLLLVQRLMPEAAFPLYILHDHREEDALTLRFSGITPSRVEQDCLQEVMEDLAFLGEVSGLAGAGSGEIYVIGREPLNMADRIATLHAKTPEAAMLKFAAVVYPGIAHDYESIQNVEMEGLAMRQLDTWRSCDIEKLWAEAKKSLLSHVDPSSEPEPDFDF